MTQIIVHDTIGTLKPFFTSKDRPKQVAAQAFSALFDADSLPGLIRPKPEHEAKCGHCLWVMAAAGIDGAGMGQQVYGLFNPTRSKDASIWQFERFNEIDITGKLERALKRFANVLPAAQAVEQIECFLFPADMANRHIMIYAQGLNTYGGIPGKISISLWPDEGNLARLEPALARVFFHTVRQNLLDANGFTTLADWLVTEGLAAAFVESQFPDFPMPYAVAFHQPDHWEAELTRIATTYYGEEKYDEVMVNVFGAMSPIGSYRYPQPVPLDADELPYAIEVITEGLGETTPQQIAAYLYGDEPLALQGHATVGLPAFAGYEVAYRLVKAYLEQMGQTIVEVASLPTSEIMQVVRSTVLDNPARYG